MGAQFEEERTERAIWNLLQMARFLLFPIKEFQEWE